MQTQQLNIRQVYELCIHCHLRDKINNKLKIIFNLLFIWYTINN